MSEALHDYGFRDAATDGELDVLGIGRAISRRKKWVVIPVMLAFVAASVYVNVVKPRYTGEAQVLVENQENYFTRPDNSAPQVDTAPDEEAVTSQIQLVTSRDLARDAVKQLRLEGRPEFDPAAVPNSAFARVLILLGLRRAPTDLSVEDRILQSYYDRLSVTEVAKSRVLDIDFASQDPELAAKAANTIADLYIGLQADAKRNRAHVAAESLATQIADLRTKVADAQNKATAFRASAGLLVGNNNTTIASQQLGDITSQLAVARTAEADAQAKAQLIRDMLRQGRLDDVSDVANNELIRQVSAQRISLRAQLALESRTYLPEHPRIKELKAQLADLESALRSAAEQTARSLQNDAKVAGARVTNLQAALDQQKQKVGDSSADEAKLQELDGDAQVLKSQLDAATAKYQEALARQNAGSTPGDARVISRAMAPIQPTFPKKVPLIAFATLAALVLSVAFIIASELMSGRAFVVPAPETMPEADFEPGLPILASEAEHGASPPSSAIAIAPPLREQESQEDADSSEIENLAQRLGRDSPGDYAVRILTAASSPAASCLPAAAALARALSRGRRVILVELDAAETGNIEQPGLFELINGHASFAEVIHRDRGSRLHHIGAGRRSVEPCDELDLTLDALSQTYDYVVLSAPPGAAATTNALGPEADFVVLVCTGDPTDAVARDTLVRNGAGEIFSVGPETRTETLRQDTKTAA